MLNGHCVIILDTLSSIKSYIFMWETLISCLKASLAQFAHILFTYSLASFLIIGTAA